MTPACGDVIASSNFSRAVGQSHDANGHFPRILQQIALPVGERMTFMEKLTFPFYYHDGDNGERGRSQCGNAGESRLVFGWSLPYLRFSSPTVLGTEGSLTFEYLLW